MSKDEPIDMILPLTEEEIAVLQNEWRTWNEGRLVATIRARDEKIEALRKALETAIDLATRALEQAHLWRRLAKIHVPAIDKEREP